MNLKNKTILVIGGAGFIGSHFIEKILEKESCRIIVFDNFIRGKKENLKSSIGCKNVEIYQKGNDINHLEILINVMSEERVDYVIHFAALWLLHCQEFPQTAFDVNIKGTFNVLEACRINKIKKIIFSSSASVYGDNQHELITENHPQHSKNLYGATKIACEAIIRAYHHKYKMNIIGLRYMNVYGPRQDYRGAYIAVIMKMLDAIDNDEPITIYGNGKECFDFVSVKDCAIANYLALKSKINFGFYNVGSGKGTSLKKLAQILIKLSNSNNKIIYKQNKDPTLVKNRVSDISLAKKELNYSPSINLKNGLKDLINWRNKQKNPIN